MGLCVLHASFVSVYVTAMCLHITWSFVYKCESGSKCFCVMSEIVLTIFVSMNILINMQSDDVSNSVVEEGCRKMYNKKIILIIFYRFHTK